MKTASVCLQSRSAFETRKFGVKIGRLLRAGDVVALCGELGAGKTTLIRGIAGGLGVKFSRDITSPTFALVHEYAGREKIYHMDWYRLAKIEGDDERLVWECFSDAEAVTLVEWAERGLRALPKDFIRIELAHAGGDRRRLRVGAAGKKYGSFLESLA